MAEGRRAAQRERMRARLLDAALRLFAEQGYEATTIDQIAREADVARQTVLNHYPHKRDFPIAWGAQRRERLRRLGERADPDEPARDRLHRYFAELAAMNEPERELTRVLRAGLRHDDVAAEHRPVPEAVVAAVRSGRDSGEFADTPAPEVVAEVITAVYSDTLSRWLPGDTRPFDLADALAERLNLLLDGLRAR